MARSFSARLKARRGPRARRNLRGLGYTVDLPLPWEDEGADVESEDGGQSVDPGILFPGTGTEPNTPPPSGGTGNPSEVPLRPASYDFELEPPEYVIEPNDTMWGISLAWYGTGSR
ncbi:MAG: hypothetical protein HOV80_22050, partial [Polyangiaceae bacterium]|nr:hypothetical protein [Polyangiaceae bacterium]